MPDLSTLTVRHLGTMEYLPVWRAMQAFTDQRDSETADEIWLLQHKPVYTQGQAGKAEHILNAGDIPVVQVDRGGQVTYHGPGQLVAYLLIDLKRRQLGVRNLVTIIEGAIVKLLADYNVNASPRADAPGVYVDLDSGEPGPKVAQLGLRVRRGCSFHGLSLNIDMDMRPFAGINPCGYAGMDVTSMQRQTRGAMDIPIIGQQLIGHLATGLAYNQYQHIYDGQLPL